MIKISLEDYKYNKQYLLLFDILIKQEYTNKDIYLENLNITPSSYRRAKISEQSIGENIVYKLCDEFNIKQVSKNQIEQYEMFINKIYYDYYYNLNNNNIYVLGKLDELINDKNLMYPIFLLFKLLFSLIVNTNKNIIINENQYLFDEVMKYKSYYIDQLKDVLSHVEILYDKEFKNKKIFLDSNNGITYSVVSSKYLENDQYIECLYYAQKAKEIFLKDENYKRIANINFNIMQCYCYLNNFEKYYEMAYTQYFSNNSFNEINEIKEMSDKHFAISMIALNKYDEIEYYLKNKIDITFTEVLCLLIARFNICKQEYKKYYHNIKDVLLGDQRLEILETINAYLVKNDKKKLKKLKNIKLQENLLYVLKNKGE